MILPARPTARTVAAAVLSLVTAAATANPANAARPLGAAPRTVAVSSADELARALAAAKPGDTIRLAAGTYEGDFTATADGTPAEPITLTGTADAVLSNHGGYGLHLDGAAYWRLTGFSVRRAKKGLVLDGARHVDIDRLDVSQIDEEGVHFRRSSTDNVIRRSRVHDTGLRKPQYGEAVYVGSAKSNWGTYGQNGGPDRSDRNQVLDNELGPNVAAEHIDVKEGTEGGVVSGNTFDGHGISGANYADSWMDVKGNGYRIEGNTGTFDGDGALADGYQTHSVVDGYGCGNTFRANHSDLGGAPGYAINVTDQRDCAAAPNTVYRDNTVTGAGKGLTNIAVTG